MSGRTLLILLVACVVVGGVILVFELEDSHREHEPGLLGISPATVEAITVISEMDTVRVAKRGTAWMIEHPVMDMANSRAVETLISELETVKGKRSFPADGGLSAYGLDPPSVQVTTQDSSTGYKARIAIGGTNPTGSSRYAQIGDSTLIHLVDAGLKQRLGKDLWDLRSHALISVDPAQIDTVTQIIGDQKTILVRDDLSWSMSSPAKAAADGDAVSSFLRELQGSAINGFRDLSKKMRKTPRATWIFQSGLTQRGETLWVGETTRAELEVESSVRAYGLAVDTSLVASLLASPERWRSRQLLPFYSYKSDELTIEKPGQESLTLRKDEDGLWRLGAWGADSDKIMDLVRQLEDCKVEGFMEDEADTLWERSLILSVSTRDFETAIIEFGPLRNGQRPVRAHHLGGPAYAGCIDPDSISLEPLNWRDRKLLSFYPYQIKEVEIRAQEREALAKQKNYGEWKQSGAWDNDVSIDDLLEAISESRIALFPEELTALPELGAETSILLKRDDRENVEIHLYAFGPDSLAGRVGEGEICILEPELRETMEAALKNP